MNELWKPHPTLRIYVSTYGNVYRAPCEIGNKVFALKRLTPQYSDAGYRELRLQDEGKRTRHPVGQLVLETFIGPRPKGLVCVHGELGSDDDRLSNVVWAKRGTRRDKATSLATEAAEQFLANPGLCIALATMAGYEGGDGDKDERHEVDNSADGPPGYRVRKTYRGPVRSGDRQAGAAPLGLRRHHTSRAQKALQDCRSYYR